MRLKLSGPSRRSFRMSGYDVLVNENQQRKSAGQNYSIKIQARSVSGRNQLLALWVIEILVVKRNTYAPHFSQDTFTAEVFRLAEPGTQVIQISATDRDAEEYNSKVTYSLRTSPAALFTIEKDTGWVETVTSLMDAKPVLHLQVTATDSGYPVMSMAVGVTIIVRDIGGRSFQGHFIQGHFDSTLHSTVIDNDTFTIQ